MSELTYKNIEFTVESAKFANLVVLTPRLPVGADWGFLGQVAWRTDGESQDRKGLVVLAKDGSDALGDIVDWKPVFIDIEQGQFSTWRGIPANSDDYVSGGDFFVLGTDKPTQEQTLGIKAIRRNLISERPPHRLVWEYRLPKAIISIWDIIAVDRLHVATGAFASTGTSIPEDLMIPVVRFNA